MDSNIDLGIGQIPDLSNLLTDPTKLDFSLIQIYNALGILQQALGTTTGIDQPDPSAWATTGATSSVQLQNLSILYLNAGVNINQGQLISIDSGGNAILANASNGTKPCRAICNGNVTSGTAGQFIMLGAIGFFATGTFVPGDTYYLDITDGSYTVTKPTVTGNLVQAIGFAVDNATLIFNPDIAITIEP